MHLSDPARLGHPTTFPVQFGFAATGNDKSACRKLIRWGLRKSFWVAQRRGRIGS